MPKLRLPTKSLNAVSLAIIGAAAVLMIAGIAYYAQQERQRIAIDLQTSRTNQLISEVKAISEENQRLNRQNSNYAYCNATILAKYTQDQQPIVIDDLNACILSSFPQDSTISPVTQATIAPSTAGSAQGAQTAQTPQSSTSPAQGGGATPTRGRPTPSILGVPLPCVNFLIIKTCR